MRQSYELQLAGFAALFILLDQSDGDDFTNIRTEIFHSSGTDLNVCLLKTNEC